MGKPKEARDLIKEALIRLNGVEISISETRILLDFDIQCCCSSRGEAMALLMTWVGDGVKGRQVLETPR